MPDMDEYVGFEMKQLSALYGLAQNRHHMQPYPYHRSIACLVLVNSSQADKVMAFGDEDHRFEYSTVSQLTHPAGLLWSRPTLPKWFAL